MTAYHLDNALLPSGFARDVVVEIEDGLITSVRKDRPAADGAERLRGIAVPGMPNLHSHAFQRGMAGLAERRGPANDTFWTWREVMYRFLGRLSPEDVEAVAAFAYLEMLEGGYTLVGEFHYLHHDTAGQRYGDIAELSGRIAAAALETGIGLTLLPCFYAQGGFGGRPPVEGQRRFINDPDTFARLLESARRHLTTVPRARIGVAPHSLRAVTPEALAAVVSMMPDGPIHIHAAEQWLEVEDCVAWSGLRPVEWLLENAAPDESWCLIHATHMTADETVRLAETGAVAGLCPLTEGSLGDGTFEGPRFLGAGGTLGIGTDSNIQVDAAAELRQLEYSQRLHHRGRNLMTVDEGESTGRRLVASALAGGARAMGQPMGAIAPGHRADLVVLDSEHPALAASGPDSWLDCWVFCAGKDLVKDVVAGGARVVTDGRHHGRETIVSRYRASLARLVGEV